MRLLVLLFSFLFTMTGYTSVRPHIRVKVGKNLNKVDLKGLDLTKQQLGEYKKTYPGSKRLRFNCSTRFDAEKRSKLFASLSSPAGMITWENKYPFLGKMEVATAETGKGCDLINIVSMDDYISTLLAKEMNGNWKLEALKAQAVAARTYAWSKILKGEELRRLGKKTTLYDLESSEKHQVSGNLLDITQKTKMAAKGTKGEILVAKNGTLTPIFYHAECGGPTLLPNQVWGNAVEGYKSVACRYSYGKHKWKATISKGRFKKFLSWVGKRFKEEKIVKALEEAKSFHFTPDRISKTKIRCYIGDQVVLFNKSLLRRFFGSELIQSNHWEIKKKGRVVFVRGVGKGHGVGMSQLGALHMAQKGKSYKEILKHYFPNHKLKKIEL